MKNQYNKTYSSISRVFEEKFKDWKEEEHQVAKMIIELIKDKGH